MLINIRALLVWSPFYFLKKRIEILLENQKYESRSDSTARLPSPAAPDQY